MTAPGDGPPGGVYDRVKALAQVIDADATAAAIMVGQASPRPLAGDSAVNCRACGVEIWIEPERVANTAVIVLCFVCASLVIMVNGEAMDWDPRGQS